MAGQKVRTLLNGRLLAGEHGFIWDGRDCSGRRVSAGTYLVNLRSGDRKITQRLVLVK